MSRALAVLVLGCTSSDSVRLKHITPDLPSGSDSGSDTGRPSPDDTGVPPTSSLPDWLEGSDPVPCTAPADGVVYEEVGEAMGLEGRRVAALEHTESGSLAVADFDEDGDLDVVIGHNFELAVMYVREGEGFVREDLPTRPHAMGMSVVDANGDGHLDLAVAGMEPLILFREGEGWRAEDLPLHEHHTLDSLTKALVPGDLDNDGDLDLYAVRSGAGAGFENLDFVYINDGTGSYTVDMTQVPETERYRRGFDAKWFDLDGDGWQEVFVINERFEPAEPSPGRDGSFLLRNDGGQLSRDDGSCLCELVLDGMGLDIEDINGDGRPDIYLSASMNNVLLQQLEDHSYVDVSLLMSANPLDGTLLTMSWGAAFLDFDNDGLRDLIVAEGDLWHELSADPVVVDLPLDLMRLVETETGRAYQDVSADYGFGVMGSWRSIAALDHNGDGLVDPIITDVEHRPLMYMSQGCTANGWLRVEAPIHSKIELTAGGRTQTAWIDTHSSFAASTQPEFHFGLGATNTVTSLVVTLPTGEKLATTEAFEARRKVKVK